MKRRGSPANDLTQIGRWSHFASRNGAHRIATQLSGVPTEHHETAAFRVRPLISAWRSSTRVSRPEVANPASCVINRVLARPSPTRKILKSKNLPLEVLG